MGDGGRVRRGGGGLGEGSPVPFSPGEARERRTKRRRPD
jgi:hypothetical protein